MVSIIGPAVVSVDILIMFISQIFSGHDADTDRNTPIRQQFPTSVNLRFIRIYLTMWVGFRCALRFELYGCKGKERRISAKQYL